VHGRQTFHVLADKRKVYTGKFCGKGEHKHSTHISSGARSSNLSSGWSVGVNISEGNNSSGRWACMRYKIYLRQTIAWPFPEMRLSQQSFHTSRLSIISVSLQCQTNQHGHELGP
jgi:hypothetical protein